MKRVVSILFSASLCISVIGCSGNGNNNEPDAGLDASDTFPEAPLITVAGHAAVYPDALGWQPADGGTPLSSVEGLTVRVEEPLLVALGQPDGVFGTQTLPADGAFSIPNVDTGKVTIGLAAGVRDPEDAGVSKVVPAATTVFDVILEQHKPETDINDAKAYALPREWVSQLDLAITPARFAALNGDGSDGGTGFPDTLEASGFILGKIVDATGAPVQGVKISASKYGDRFFYPSKDFTSISDTGTSENGLFLFVWNGNTPDLFDYTVVDHPEYLKRRGGATGGAGLVVTVYPGTTAP